LGTSAVAVDVSARSTAARATIDETTSLMMSLLSAIDVSVVIDAFAENVTIELAVSETMRLMMLLLS